MAEGDIGAVIDTLIFDAVSGSYPSILKISDTVCAIAYGGPDTHGWLCTVKINADGSIDNAVIDDLEFDPVYGKRPSLVHVAGDVYAIAYVGPDVDGWICTVTISAAGAIDDTVIDTYEWLAADVYYPHIIQLSTNFFLIADRLVDSYGWVVSVQISVAGAITDPYTDRLQFAPFGTAEPIPIKINSTICACVYRDIDNDGWLATLPVSEAGSIGDATIDTYEFQPTYAADPDILHVSENVYLIAYMGTANSGWLITVAISAAGVITQAPLDSYEFILATAQTPTLLHVTGNVFMVAYTDADSDLDICTVTVSPTGTITKALIDELEIDPSSGQFPVGAFVTGNIYAIAYQGASSIGKILTVDIETAPPTAQADHLMMLGMG